MYVQEATYLQNPFPEILPNICLWDHQDKDVIQMFEKNSKKEETTNQY